MSRVIKRVSEQELDNILTGTVDIQVPDTPKINLTQTEVQLVHQGNAIVAQKNITISGNGSFTM